MMCWIKGVLMRMRLIWIATILLLWPISEFINAQTTTAPMQRGNVQRAPLATLYRHFLAYQLHLDRAADSVEKRGKNGNDFRNHFQKKLNFTDEEFAQIRASSLRLESALQKKDAEAKAVIDATRSNFPKQSIVGQSIELPPVPPKLLALQKERDKLIENEVQDLKTKLGPKAAARMDEFLEADFAPSVTAQSVALPRLHDPAQHPVPPFPDQAVTR
jgi:hypothetical protein